MNPRQRGRRRDSDDPGPVSVAGPGPGSSTAIDEAWQESERQRLVPPGEPPAGPCDWGDCEEYAVAWRHDPEHGYLPVCETHRGPVDEELAAELGEHVLVTDDELALIRWAGYDAAIAEANAHRERALDDARARLGRATEAAYARYRQDMASADESFDLARRAAMNAHELAQAGQAAP